MPQFKPGQSGNPQGRRLGAVGLPGKLRAALAKEAGAIIETLVAQAKAGDVAAARLILDRVCPPLRAVDLPAALPGKADLSDPVAGPAAILSGLASGTLTPEQASQYAATLAALVRVREAVEFEQRIAALESRQGIPSLTTAPR